MARADHREVPPIDGRDRSLLQALRGHDDAGIDEAEPQVGMDPAQRPHPVPVREIQLPDGEAAVRHGRQDRVERQRVGWSRATRPRPGPAPRRPAVRGPSPGARGRRDGRGHSGPWPRTAGRCPRSAPTGQVPGGARSFRGRWARVPVSEAPTPRNCSLPACCRARCASASRMTSANDLTFVACDRPQPGRVSGSAMMAVRCICMMTQHDATGPARNAVISLPRQSVGRAGP